MKIQRSMILLVALSAGGSLSGCALLSKSEPLAPRYFTPDLSPRTDEPNSEHKSGQKLRLGSVKAGPHLRERMAYRTSEQEVAYYNERRWTERPEAYLSRALSRSLFEEHGFVRAISGASHTLDAELVSFEEIKTADHVVRVQVVINLYDMAGGHLQRTVQSEKKVEERKDDPEAVVLALSDALRSVVSEITKTAKEHFSQSPAATQEHPSEGRSNDERSSEEHSSED